MNDGIKTVQSRFVLAAIVCALLLIANYFAMVGTPWGHQFDDDAFLGRKALVRKVITLDSDLLKLVRKRTLFLGAMATLAIAVMRRCTIVGVIAVAALDARRSLNTCSHGICWYPMTPCLKVAFRRPWLAIAGGCISATFATGVLFVGWHR